MDPTDDTENPGSLVADLRQIIDEPIVDEEHQQLFTKLIASQVSLYTTHRKYVEQLYQALEFKVLASMSMLITGTKMNGSLLKTTVNKLTEEQNSLEKKFDKILENLASVEKSNQLILEQLANQVVHISSIEEKENVVLETKLDDISEENPSSSQMADQPIVPSSEDSSTSEQILPNQITQTNPQVAMPTSEEIVPPIVSQLKTSSEETSEQKSEISPTSEEPEPESQPLDLQNEQVEEVDDEDFDIQSMMDQLSEGEDDIVDESQESTDSVDPKTKVVSEELMVKPIEPIKPIPTIPKVKLNAPPGISGLPVYGRPLSLNGGQGSQRSRLQISTVASPGNHLKNNSLNKIRIPVLPVIPSVNNGQPGQNQEKIGQMHQFKRLQSQNPQAQLQANR